MTSSPTPLEPEPTQSLVQAAIALLADDSPRVAGAARERLLRWGALVEPELRVAAEVGDVRIRLRARAVLRALDVRQCLHRFAALPLGDGASRDAGVLLDGAVLLAQMVRTYVPDAAELARWLRSEAEVLRARFAGRSLPTCARLLAEHVHGTLGFRAASGEVELDHVMLDRVLHHRIGVPVTLSLVHLLLARGAGLSVAGVALPDHFLVRLHGPRPVLVDPLHEGRTVTKADCARHLRAAGYDRVRMHLRDLPDRGVLAHYLRALKRAGAHRAGPEAQASLGHALAHLEAR